MNKKEIQTNILDINIDYYDYHGLKKMEQYK
jgi:hypothetical protein